MKEYPLTIPVCQLDENNYFIGMTVADLDPRDKNHGYLIPAQCILTDPPEIKKGYKSKWNGSGWVYLENHIGEIAYDKNTGLPVTIEKMGVLDESLTTLIPPKQYMIWSTKENNWIDKKDSEELRLLDRRKNAGYLNRYQFLTQVEIQYNKNKDNLIKLVEQKIKNSINKIKVRNAILEAQTFTLENSELWAFLTDTLNIKIEEIFDLWEEAKKIY